MIIHTLSSDASVALELGHRIARTELRRQRPRRSALGAVRDFLFPRLAALAARA